jgi:hypothetical protein
MAMTTVDCRRETVSLIGSDKVDGTPAYGMDDRKIGTARRGRGLRCLQPTQLRRLR